MANVRGTSRGGHAGSIADSWLVKLGLGLANWSERWFPDPLVFALAGIVIVFLFGLCLRRIARQAGNSGWQELLDSGSFHHADGDDHHWRICGRDHSGGVTGSSRWLAIPKRREGAIAMIALFSMLTSLISWGLSLIFSGLLTREWPTA